MEHEIGQYITIALIVGGVAIFLGARLWILFKK